VWRNVAAVETEPSRQAKTLVAAGDDSFQRGHHAEAIEQYSQAIRLDPNNLAAYAHRGSAYNGLGEYDHAIADLERYFASGPSAPWPHFHRGLAYEAKADFDRALADINRAIELDGKVPDY
jgi:tetratricopeptide (TPR) repeat protein